MVATKRKIAVVGSGAVGGYYGSLLSRAGQDVHFLLRSDYELVRKRGFRIASSEESFVLYPVQSYRRAEDIGPCDLVIVAVKATANSVLPDVLRWLVGPETVLMTLQNGIGNAELLAEHFGAERVVGGLCFVCINRTGPGEIQNYLPGRIDLADFSGELRERTREIAAMMSEAGVWCVPSPSLEEALWRKLCWNVPFNGLTILGGAISTDAVLASPSLTRLARLLMVEIQSAARAHGFTIEDSFLDHQFEITGRMGAYKPSSLVDYVKGREIEVEAIWGEALRRGTKAGVPMPHLETVYLLLKREF
ncbi:MAG: 2-dehydropantoate 2-reductase [Opitutales bacterium]